MTYSTPSTSKVGAIIFWVVVSILVLSSVFLSTLPINFSQANLVGVNSLFLTIFVTTLFMERAQEVILTAWRAQGSDSLALAIARLERAIYRHKNYKNADCQAMDAMHDELEELRMEKLNYRSHTQLMALRLGLLFGVLISLGGVRTLGVLIGDVGTLTSLSIFQQSIFNGVDVILTGGVIAGGSDGIHKLTALYRRFMENKTGKQQRETSKHTGIESGV